MSWLRKAIARTVSVFKAEEGPKAYASSLPGFYGRYGEPKELDQKKLLELAEGDPDVRACIDAIVDAVTTNGWVVESENERIKSQVERWILETWGEDDFWLFLRNLTGVLAIFDEAYLEVTGEVPRLIAPWTMMVKRDNYGRVTGYVQQTAYRVEFEPEEIVHIVLHPIADRAYGSPKLATLRRILEAKREAELFYYTVFMRKGVLSKAILLKTGDDQTFQRLKSELESTRPGDDLLLMGDIEVIDLGNPVRELQILEMLRDFRQKILALFRVPPIVYGLEGGVNLETSRNQMVNFQQHISSLQRIIAAGVTEAIKRILNLDGFKIRLLEWTNPEQLTRIHALRVDAGLETINEARAALGLPELDDPVANEPLPKFALKQGLAGLRVEETMGELMAQSARAFPEKGFLKAERDRDIHDDVVLGFEEPLARELRRFFRRAVRIGDAASARKELEAEVRSLLTRYAFRSAMEGIFYISDALKVAPTSAPVAEKIAEIVSVAVDDFFHIVADKLSGLAKPSKPLRDYFEIGKSEEITEEDVYPWQRLDYERRLALLGAFVIWASFNSGIASGFTSALREGAEATGLEWVAKLDERTCPICARLHGTYWSPEEVAAGRYRRPPAHPNCRCRLLAVRGERRLWAG